MAKKNKDNLKWWILLTVIIGTFLGRMDQTVVNLAIPKIINEFAITVSAAGWIATAYILANAVFVPVWGKLGDTLGRKKIYILGFTIFIFGSVLAGLSWNLSSLLVFRVIQAIASSADYPTAMAILTVTFKAGKERAQALGLWSVSFAAAIVFGPLIGGPLIDNLGWRWVFYINLPVGLLGLFMAIVFIEESKSDIKTKKFDWWGAITLGICLSALVLVLDQGVTWGWLSSYSLICYLTVIVFGAIFYSIETRHPEPIVDFKFFKNTVFTGTLINNVIVFMGLTGGVFLIPLFVQTFLGYDATQTGYLFIPLAVFMFAGSFIGGRMVGKIKANYVIASSTLVAGIGMFLLSYIDPRSTAINIIIPMSILALGLGFGMPQRTTAIASSVPESEIGIASSVLALARNIAGAFGIALFTTILTNSINSNLINTAKNSILHVKTPITYQLYTGLIILKAEISAYSTVFFVASMVMFVGAVAAIFIRVHHEKKLSPEMMVEAG